MQRHLTAVDSYGERSVFLLPVPLALLLGVLLLLEPFALYKRIAYENYRSSGVLQLPVIYLVISSVIRVFLRIVITIAVLESCAIEVENGSVWAYLFLTYFFLAEVFLGFIITDKHDRIASEPAAVVEIVAQLVCLLLLALIAAYFEKTYIRELLVDNTQSLAVKIVIAALLFLLLYIPSRLIDFYIGWVQQTTLQQKAFYVATVIVAFTVLLVQTMHGN